MTTTATAIRVLVGIAGLIMVALGAAFWTGNALTLVPIHMLIGLGIALSLWVLALLALLRGVRPGLAVVALLWGLLMPALGSLRRQSAGSWTSCGPGSGPIPGSWT